VYPLYLILQWLFYVFDVVVLSTHKTNLLGRGRTKNIAGAISHAEIVVCPEEGHRVVGVFRVEVRGPRIITDIAMPKTNQAHLYLQL